LLVGGCGPRGSEWAVGHDSRHGETIAPHVPHQTAENWSVTQGLTRVSCITGPGATKSVR